MRVTEIHFYFCGSNGWYSRVEPKEALEYLGGDIRYQEVIYQSEETGEMSFQPVEHDLTSLLDVLRWLREQGHSVKAVVINRMSNVYIYDDCGPIEDAIKYLQW